MRIFFSVGEPSGDLHGANLIRDLRRISPQTECVGFGGPKMSEAGCQLNYELTSLAVMGLWQVIFNLRKFLGLLGQADKYFAENQVDAVVLIDFPGLNWWIARKAKKHGIPVFYYGVPQIWAWGSWRVKKLRRLVDHVLCKLPFEVDWFMARGCRATYVGHPYFDELSRRPLDIDFVEDYSDDRSRLLVLLPGSRTQEVRRTLGWLAESAAIVKRQVPNVAVAVACLKPSHARFAKEFCYEHDLEIDVIAGKTSELISISDVCLACSGSVSLELLYYGKPTVIVYRIGFAMSILRRFMLKVRYITLVNLLAADQIERRNGTVYEPERPGSESVPMPEYLRVSKCSPEMARWVVKWLRDEDEMASKQAQLDQLRQRVVTVGASARAASYILHNLVVEPDSTQESPGPRRKAA